MFRNILIFDIFLRILNTFARMFKISIMWLLYKNNSLTSSEMEIHQLDFSKNVGIIFSQQFMFHLDLYIFVRKHFSVIRPLKSINQTIESDLLQFKVFNKFVKNNDSYSIALSPILF